MDVNWHAKGSTVRPGTGAPGWLRGPKTVGYDKPVANAEWKVVLAPFKPPSLMRRLLQRAKRALRSGRRSPKRSPRPHPPRA